MKKTLAEFREYVEKLYPYSEDDNEAKIDLVYHQRNAMEKAWEFLSGELDEIENDKKLLADYKKLKDAGDNDIYPKIVGHVFERDGYLLVCISPDAENIICSYSKEGNFTELVWNDERNYCLHEDAPLFDGEYIGVGELDYGLMSRIPQLRIRSIGPEERRWYVLMKPYGKI